MKLNRSVFVGISIAALFLLSSSCSSGTQRQNTNIIIEKDNSILVLPESLRKFIKTQFPNLRIPAAEDNSSRWASYSEKGLIPYSCLGDFNGDGLKDVALLLIGKGEWRTIAFHQTSENSWKWLKLERFPGSDKLFKQKNRPQEFYLYTLKTGMKLMLGERVLDRSVYQYDTIAFYRFGDSKNVMQYRWNAKRDVYVVNMFHTTE
jgi:hypothetical protein